MPKVGPPADSRDEFAADSPLQQRVRKPPVPLGRGAEPEMASLIRELADERLFGRLCHDARPVAKKVELHTMSMEFTAVSLLLLVEGLPAGRQRLVPCVSNLDDQRLPFRAQRHDRAGPGGLQ